MIILYTALAMQIPLFFFFFVFKLIMKRRVQLLSCMECQRCMGACPVARKHPEFIGPYGAMVAVKKERYDLLDQGRLELCTLCAACAQACPRSLDAIEEAMHAANSGQGEKAPKIPRVIPLQQKKSTAKKEQT